MFKKKGYKKPKIRKGGRIFDYKIFEWMRLCFLYIVHIFLRLWYCTLRIHCDDRIREILQGDKKGPAAKPTLTLLWHNRLFMSGYFRKELRDRRAVSLISAGAIGGWITPFYKFFGFEAARGSINLRGREALRELTEIIESGNPLIVITPDGSRGPRYKLKSGAAMLAQRANCHILLLSFKYENAWELKTWDGFLIPKPFSKMRVCYDYYESLGELIDSGDTKEIRAILEEKLNILNEDGVSGAKMDVE